MGVENDVTAGGLAEDDVEAGDGDDIAVDEVAQDVARADTGELVGIADEEEVAGGMDGF